jgi:hypothetical protein
LLLPGGPVDVADALEGEHQNFVPRDQNQRDALAILGHALCAFRRFVVGISLSEPRRQSSWATRGRGGGILASGGAGKLHRNAGGNHALEIHAGLVNPDDAVILVVDSNDRVGVDVFGLAHEFAYDKLPPVLLQGGAVRWMPGGGSLDPADRIENTSSFDGVGRADTHDLYLRIHFIFGWIYCEPSEVEFSFKSGGLTFT